MRSMKRNILCIPVIFWAAMAVICALLYLYPQSDIAVSALFYTPGEGFMQHHALWERILYKSVPVVLTVLYVGGLLLWIYNRKTGRDLLAFSGKKLLYMMVVAALGSGIIVNALLKENWGRARPAQVSVFGGDKHFTPPFVLSDQEGKSFSSGHTSGAFALLPLIFLARRHRIAVASVVLGYGVAVSAARIAAGGHFFSDVIVSIFIMYIVSAATYEMMFGCKKGKHGV